MLRWTLLLLTLGCSRVTGTVNDQLDTCPEPGVTECQPNNKVRICGSDKHWRVLADCDEALGDTGPFVCCDLGDAGHTCLRSCE